MRIFLFLIASTATAAATAWVSGGPAVDGVTVFSAAVLPSLLVVLGALRSARRTGPPAPAEAGR
jgi:hypothetical protein